MRILFVAAILVVAFVFAFSLYAIFRTPSTAAENTLSGKEIAVKSLNFFDDMKRSDGKYFYQTECTDDTGCKKDADVYTQSGAWPVLAYGGLYQATGDQQYLQKMNNEANDLINACNGNEDECMWILVQMVRAYQISHNVQYSTFVKNMGTSLLTNNENTGAMMTGIEAREFALLYEMTGDQKYLNEAKVRLEKSKAAWNELVDTYNGIAYSSGQFNFYRFSCWTELAEVEIARVSNDNQTLANVKDFFNSANIGNNYKNIEDLSALQPCAETLINLYKLTQDAQYYNQAKEIMQYIITYRWDSPLSIATKYNGDGAYLFEFYTGNNSKTVTDTAYMIYLLSKMPNEQFGILSWR